VIIAACGRWGHRPRRSATIGVSTNRRRFEMPKFFCNDYNIRFCYTFIQKWNLSFIEKVI